MRAFVDTSALYALLDEDDEGHDRAGDWFTNVAADETLVLATHNYAVVETAALTHRRLGSEAVRVLFDAFIPALSVIYVEEELHRRAAAAYLAGLDRSVSFVDRVSFEVMKGLGIEEAFAFDADFDAEGFRTVPAV